MKLFINLQTLVINKLHITEIVKHPGKYSIYLSNSGVFGKILLSNGIITTKYNIIEICQTKNPKDYKKITKWIETI